MNRVPVPPNDENVIVHLNPIRRDDADFIIHGLLSDWESLSRTWEQLWCRRLSVDRFRLCCIPFFLYGFSLGDIISIRSAFGLDYLLDRVQTPSGTRTYRVWFGDSPDSEYQLRDRLFDQLLESGAGCEVYSQKLFAVDASPDLAPTITEILTKGSEAGDFIFEFGNPVLYEPEDGP